MQNLGCPDVRNAKPGGRATPITTGHILMIYGPLNRNFFVDDARPFFSKKKFFFGVKNLDFRVFWPYFVPKSGWDLQPYRVARG